MRVLRPSPRKFHRASSSITMTSRRWSALRCSTFPNGFQNSTRTPCNLRPCKFPEIMHIVRQHLCAARTPPEKTPLERQIAATDAQIDRLVYDLYGLNAEEIKIVEGAS